MHVEEHHTLSELELLFKGEKNALRAMRLRCVLLARQGSTATQLSQFSGRDPRTIQSWMMHYNRDGLAGLEDQTGRGPKSCLTPEEEVRFRARIEAGAQEGDPACVLRGIDVQQILEQEFGKRRKLGAVYKFLHKLGYASLVPRPQHKNSDPKRQEDFKKSSPTSSARFKRSIPRVGCKSTPKMKSASVNKEASLVSGR